MGAALFAPIMDVGIAVLPKLLIQAVGRLYLHVIVFNRMAEENLKVLR